MRIPSPAANPTPSSIHANPTPRKRVHVRDTVVCEGWKNSVMPTTGDQSYCCVVAWVRQIESAVNHGKFQTHLANAQFKKSIGTCRHVAESKEIWNKRKQGKTSRAFKNQTYTNTEPTSSSHLCSNRHCESTSPGPYKRRLRLDLHLDSTSTSTAALSARRPTHPL